MNEVQVFTNEEFGSVRTIVVNGDPWIVGKDVAEKLGYSNASKAVSVHVDSEDKMFLMLDVTDSQNGNVPALRLLLTANFALLEKDVSETLEYQNGSRDGVW